MSDSSSGARRLEVSLLCALLALVIAQVVIYQYDHGSERHGLSHDKAKLYFFNDLPEGENLTVLQVSGNCFKCSQMKIRNEPIKPGANASYDADTTFPITIVMKTKKTNASSHTCNFTRHLREYSCHYLHFNLSDDGMKANCSFFTDDEGDDTFLPILYGFLVIGVLATLWVAMTKAYRFLTKKVKKEEVVAKSHAESESEDGSTRIQNEGPYEQEKEANSAVYGSLEHSTKIKKVSQHNPMPTLKSSLITKGTSDAGLSSPVAAEEPIKPKRLNSLDAFRGFSLIIMIFVNYGGGGYWIFQHSKWNGLTVADLVFPWFVWIMGVSIVFSFNGRRSDRLLEQLYQIFRRTILLFGLGLFLISYDSSIPLGEMRVCGVLQRLAATYFAVALTEILVAQIYKRKNFTVWGPLVDVSNNWVQWVIVILLESLWLILTFQLPVDGCPRGYLGPGGISESGKYQNCTGGAAKAIDYWILGEQHLYPGNTAKELYQLKVRLDPEGILGTLNSVVLCFLGVQAGRTLLYFRGRHGNILARFLAWGVALTAIATLLCLGQKNEGIIPINKNLWSLSFILLMAGLGYLVLAVFYLVIDVYPLWNGAPFKYPGVNSILVYMGHEVLHCYFPFSVYGESHNHLTFLSSNILAVSAWLLISYYWCSVNFFVKI